jgi:2-iminoacetate synthase
MLTLAEYLEDYARNGTKEKGYQLIEKNLAEMEQNKFRKQLEERLKLVKQGERDLYF